MGFQTRPNVAQTTRFKRSSTSSRKLTDSLKRDISSPPAAPFNNTAFLIRQQSQHREEVEISPTNFEAFDQYGSNSKNMIACCSFATNNHDQDCTYQSQAQHPVIIGLSTKPSNHSNLHLELQALQITNFPQEGYVTQVIYPGHQLHHSSNGASSAGRRKPEDLASAVHERGREIFKHRRLRSFTRDDNFDILQSNARSKTLDKIVDKDLSNNFSDVRI